MARKEAGKDKTKQDAIRIAKSNPGIAVSTIADRVGASERQVRYWLGQDKKANTRNGK